VSDRVSRLRQLLAEKKQPAMIITHPDNRRYLSGFTGSAGTLIVTPDQALLATDFRYFEQVRQQAPGWELVPVKGGGLKSLADKINELGLTQIGFESHDISVDLKTKLDAALPNVEWTPYSGLVEGLRQIKEPREIDAIVEAVRIADEALQQVMEWIEPGMTEKQVAWELQVQMRTRGAENLAFKTIVGFGANSALSHAVAGERVLEAGMPVVIDMGALVDGYCSDMTRSFCVGHADDLYRRRWNIVLEAQLTAEKGIKAGMTGFEADKLARDVIAGAGYGENYGHGLGHSLGLAIHENPRCSTTSQEILPADCTMTVEPGLYVFDWGGIRIEDTTVIQEDGLRILTQTPKEPVVREGLG